MGAGRKWEGRKEKGGQIRTALLACSGMEVSSLYVFVPVVAPFSNAADMMGMLGFFLKSEWVPNKQGGDGMRLGCNGTLDDVSNKVAPRSRYSEYM
jgi:hypothetical protein